MPRFMTVISILVLAGLACGTPTPAAPLPSPAPSAFTAGGTAFGFFPSPPEISLESVLAHYTDLGKHADLVLLQNNIPWQAFPLDDGSQPQALIDIRNQVILARQNHLDTVFVVDPLNGLNRREFAGLPWGWEASFQNPRVRQAYLDFTLWIVRTFEPGHLGLASEINTYADAHPEDFPHFVSLYRETYAAIKAEAPATQVFVTFQWEDLNNLFPADTEGRAAYQVNWDQVEVFEPQLDLWVISSYPFVAFSRASEIPDDYYTPLLSHTSKPLAVAEGGYAASPAGPFPGEAQDQVGYLQAIDRQIGGRLSFWVYLLLTDFNIDSYASVMRRNGTGNQDIDTLGLFTSVGLQESDGSPKPALAIWDDLRATR
jgi:hypothetical protein